jgi:CheY-like chemotaxis protein
MVLESDPAPSSAPEHSLVLIVDDYPALRATLVEVFTQEGYAVAEAPDGEAAWKWICGRRANAEPLPDAILFDLVMPRVDGWELRRRLLDNPDFRRIPAIVISGSGMTPEQLEKLAVSAAFAKPFDFRELMEVLTSICRVTK